MATPDAIRSEIVRVAHLGLGRHEFARDATRVLRRAVPFYRVAVVWFDPATELPVDAWIDNSPTGNGGSVLPETELHEADVKKFRQLAASGRRAASLSAETRSEFDRRRLRRHGFGDELRAVCVGESGMWSAPAAASGGRDGGGRSRARDRVGAQ